jgi:hypothetical protein
MWSMLRPKPLHGPFIAGNSALEVQLIEWHLGLFLSHTVGLESFPKKVGDFHSWQSFANVRPRHIAEQLVMPGRVGTSARAIRIN